MDDTQPRGGFPGDPAAALAVAGTGDCCGNPPQEASALPDPGDAVGFDGFTVTAVPEVYAAPVVSWHDGSTVRALESGRDVAVHLASADQPLVQRGPLALAGHADPLGRWLLVPPEMSLNRPWLGRGLVNLIEIFSDRSLSCVIVSRTCR